MTPERRWFRSLGLVLLLTSLAAAAPAPRRGVAGPGGAPAKPIVSRIELTGLEHIDESAVRDAMQLKVGQPYDPDRLQKDVDAIYQLGWFYFAKDNPAQGSVITRREDADGNVEIHMALVENPVVSAIKLVGASRTLSPESLAANVPWLKVGQPLNSNTDRVNRALHEIEAQYKAQFGLDVTASLPRAGEQPPFLQRNPDGTVTLTIKVTEPSGGKTTPAQGTAPAPTTPTAPTTPPTPATPGTGATTPSPGTGAPTTGQPAKPETQPSPPGPGIPAPTTPTTPGTTTPTTPGQDETLLPEERLKVTGIRIEGLKNLSTDLVLGTIQTKIGMPWDRDRLQKDINRLYELGWFYFSVDRDALVGLGYPVQGPDVGSKAFPEPDANRTGVVVVFRMVENPKIRQVRLVGNTLLKTPELIKDLAYLKTGAVLNTNPDKLDRDRDRVEQKYSAQGYLAQVAYGSPADNVSLLRPEPDGSVTVTLRVTELKVGTINFAWTNKKKTSERVFRAYMHTKPGDFFNRNKILEDLNEIRRLDLLEDIRVREPQVSPEDPTRLNLTFEVTEKRTGNISAGGGISSRFGLVGFIDISENNLWGLAQRIAGRVEFGGRFNFSTSYFLPLLDGAGSELNFRLYNTEDRTGATGIGAFVNRRANFDQTRRGGSILFSRPLLPELRASVEYELENVTTQRRGAQLPNLPPFPFQDLGSDTTSSVTFGLTHDTRDFPLDASRGMYQSATVQIAGLGGDNKFGKYRVETRHYLPVLGGHVNSGKRDRPTWVVATRGIFGWSSGKPPFSQSFFVGGSETLRGYSEDRFFGDRMFLFNLELRRQFKNNIQAVAFFDAGRAWFRGETMDFFGDLASAVGVGLRVATPVGPIRFDVGFGGEGTKTHFSFGQPF